MPFPAAFRADTLRSLAAFQAGLLPDLQAAMEDRHRRWLNEAFCPVLTTHRIALVLPNLYDMRKLNGVPTDNASVRLLGRRNAVPDDFSRLSIDRGGKLGRWAGRIRGSLARRASICCFGNTHGQGHGPATARGLLSRPAIPVSVP